MKRSHVATLLVFFLLIPATLLLGSVLPGRRYYITVTLMMVELMIPFFLAFEGRRPQARELVLIAVLCALAIAGRVVIPLPNVKATFAIIIISGIVFGPESGFMVGAVTAFVSNFFYGQGPYTPWQMMAYGAAGMLAGFAFRRGRLPVKPWVMALFGFLAVVVWIGPLMDCSSLFLRLTNFTGAGAAAVFLSGLPMNVTQGVSTAAVLLLLGRPLLDRLERVRIKYGMLEGAGR